MTIKELIEEPQKYPESSNVGIYLEYPGRFAEYDSYYSPISSIDTDEGEVYLNVE